MKLRNFFVGALTALAFIVGCQEKEQNLGTPEISISVSEMTFDAAGDDKALTVTSTREWKVEYDADWVAVSPSSGKASANPQTVTVSVLENTGYDRSADLVFTIGLKKQYLTVTQAGPAGSTDNLIIYSNDYDKMPAEQDSNKYWPYADAEHSYVWNNAKGTGAANVTYASYNVTARNNSNSDGDYSDYAGSGVNNLFFGKSNPYFATYNISLGGATGLTLTFGTEKYSQTLGSVFTNSEYHIYLSNDGTKWVELTDYTFAGGETAGRWNVATANFTVPAETQNLSICMQVDAESAYRLDDFKLVASEGGVEIDFTNAVEKNFAAGSAPGGDNGGDNGGQTPTPPADAVAMTIADVLAYDGALPAGATIEGVVISNMYLNNLTSKKGMYIQDATGAVQLRFKVDHTFAFGSKITVDLSGLTKGAYNGAVQFSDVVNENAKLVSTDNTVTPKTVTMADFLANKYEGQYVAIGGVQVADSDLSNTFVMGGAHTSINMEDASGNKFVVFSSKYASYGATAVPQGSGTIKGISSINDGAMQLIFAQDSDYAGLTGTRFDGTEVTPPAGGDDNQGGTEEPDQPVTPPTTGNEVWKYEFKSGDFGSTYSAPVTKTFNGVEWTCTMIGSTYFGYDSNNGRGVQMGRSKEPAQEITLSTAGITGNIKKVVVNTSGATGTDAKLNAKVGEVALGSQVSMTTTATDVTFEATTATAGVLELKWTLTTVAVYVKSITVYTE